jgi:hypothetical protein
MRYVFRIGFAFALGFALIAGCSDSEGAGGDGGTGGVGGMDDSPYASKDLWLCRPDIENDRCDTADLSMTEIQPDGTKVVLDEVAPNSDAEVDCFYVYHTVNHDPEPGNTETLVPHPENVIGAVFRNGAHYRGACRVFAPLYHQMSLITYSEFVWRWHETEYFQRGYDDVVDAFEYYMRNHNEGRGLVLIGHSQGSHVLTRLLQEKFDDDEAMRAQLISAVLMGPTAAVQVLEGERVGGSFENIPLCASPTETGCAIAFDAHDPTGDFIEREYSQPIYPPNIRACVNPASFDDGPGTLAALMYPRTYDSLIPFPDGVDTEWVRYPNIYTSQCSNTERHLEIGLSADYTGDVPITPLELQEAVVEVWGANSNLHSAEYFIANTDLVRIVEQQIAAWTSN